MRLKSVVMSALFLVVVFLFSTTGHAQAAPTLLANGTVHSNTLNCTPGPPVSGVTVAGFNFYRSTTSGAETGTTALNGTSPLATCSYVDTNVTPGQTFYYKAQAQSTSGTLSSPSNEVTATTPNNPSAPTLTVTVAVLYNGPNNKKETITATISDMPGVDTAYTLWGDGKILKNGSETMGPSGSYTLTWQIAKYTASNLWMTVGDANGQVAASE